MKSAHILQTTPAAVKKIYRRIVRRQSHVSHMVLAELVLARIESHAMALEDKDAAPF